MRVTIHYVLRKHTRGLNGRWCRGGAYAVKIVTMQRLCLFGRVQKNAMVLNDAGTMIEQEWAKIVQMCRGVAIEPCVVMPNHVHGIISVRDEKHQMDSADIIEQFKETTAQRYSDGVREHGWHEGCEVLWQRNYLECTLKSQVEIETARRYILDNPLRWELDRENPDSL